MAEEIRKILDEYKEHTDQKVDEVKRHFDEKATEIKRHFDVVRESLEDKIGTISEQVVANSEDITSIKDKLTEHDKRFDKIDDTLAVMKLDIEFIKNELKQKISRDEFAALEKRVSMMEIKFNKIS